MARDKALLHLELRLLVARYGSAEVAGALSTIEGVDIAALDSDIRGYAKKKAKTRARRHHEKSVEDLVILTNPPPAVRDLVEKLAHAFRKREFLPQLRHVRRFLESRRIAVSKFRSRSDALPTLLRVLSEQDADELTALYEGRAGSDSDLGIITDQILGTRD